MKNLKTALCVALLLVSTNIYANSESFYQMPDSLNTDEYPVYGYVLKEAYYFLFFSPTENQSVSNALLCKSGWEYDGTSEFPRLKIFADDYLTDHYGKFVFEIGENEERKAFLVNFFAGTIKPIPLQNDGYGPQDEEDIEFGKELNIHYRFDYNRKVPFAEYGTSEMCYISLQDQKGRWLFVFLHSGLLCNFDPDVV